MEEEQLDIFDLLPTNQIGKVLWWNELKNYGKISHEDKEVFFDGSQITKAHYGERKAPKYVTIPAQAFDDGDLVEFEMYYHERQGHYYAKNVKYIGDKDMTVLKKLEALDAKLNKILKKAHGPKAPECPLCHSDLSGWDESKTTKLPYMPPEDLDTTTVGRTGREYYDRRFGPDYDDKKVVERIDYDDKKTVERIDEIREAKPWRSEKGTYVADDGNDQFEGVYDFLYDESNKASEKFKETNNDAWQILAVGLKRLWDEIEDIRGWDESKTTKLPYMGPSRKEERDSFIPVWVGYPGQSTIGLHEEIKKEDDGDTEDDGPKQATRTRG